MVLEERGSGKSCLCYRAIGVWRHSQLSVFVGQGSVHVQDPRIGCYWQTTSRDIPDHDHVQGIPYEQLSTEISRQMVTRTRIIPRVVAVEVADTIPLLVLRRSRLVLGVWRDCLL